MPPSPHYMGLSEEIMELQTAIATANDNAAVWGGKWAVYQIGRKFACGPFNNGVRGMIYATLFV